MRLFGRVELAERRPWASSEKNQLAWRHSARIRALKAPMNALSVGVPGLEKSSSTPVR